MSIIRLLRISGALGLSLLCVACVPAARVPSKETPIGSTQRAAPAVTTRAAVQIIGVANAAAGIATTAIPTDTPITPTMTAVPACSEPHGRLSVSNLTSAALSRRMAYSIYLPPCYDADRARVYPVLYLLPGLNSDHTQWPDLDIPQDEDALIAQHSVAPFVVVMPDGGYGKGDDYAAFVVQDLIPHVEQTARVSRLRADRTIGGVSRGGYWALLIALTHPDLFAAVGGHSAAIYAPLDDLVEQFGQAAARNTLRFYLDVGSADSLAETIKPFAASLAAQGFDSVFHLYSGGRERAYWRMHASEYLLFYAADWQR